MFEVTENWKAAFPGACAGVLVLQDVANPAVHAGIESQKEALVADLRARYAGQDRKALAALPVLQAYDAYYKQFKKTYHVQLQLESIVFKGRSFPSVAALVEAMFMAEVKNMLLTAGHDLDALRLPVILDATHAGASYTVLRGDAQEVKEGDMCMADRDGIISTIVYGPDQRTQIRPETRNAMFTVYAPAGIGPDRVKAHLEDIVHFAWLAAPNLKVGLLQVFSANPPR